MSGLSYLLPSYDKIIMFFSFCESFKNIKNEHPICGSHSRILPSTGLPLRLLDRLLEEEGNLEVLPRRRRQDGGVVEARAEEAGSAGHWAVLEVDRRPHDAHLRRQLARLVGREFDDRRVLDVVVLLRVLVRVKARRGRGVGPLAEAMGLEKLDGRAKVGPQRCTSTRCTSSRCTLTRCTSPRCTCRSYAGLQNIIHKNN